MFISHFHHTNLLPMNYGRVSIFYIILILFFCVGITVRRKKIFSRGENLVNYFTRETSEQLKGAAILILLLGHLELALVDGSLRFAVDEWAVMIFLFVSAISLYKTYGFNQLRNDFLYKRLKRLIIPTWMVLFIFLVLDFFLLGRSHSVTKIFLMFLGIIGPGPPNGPMWFVSYIVFLYLLYFMLSRLDCSLILKVLIFWAFLYFERYLYTYGSLFFPGLKNIFWYLKLWGEFAIIYPFSIIIGMNNGRIFPLLGRLHCYSSKFYLLIILLLLLLFMGSIHLFSMIPMPYFVLLFIKSLSPAILVCALVFITLFLDRAECQSFFLSFLGKYSFEIFLVHLPFMVYYDFFLYRSPLVLWFFIYFLFVIMCSLFLNFVSVSFIKKINW